MRLMGVDVGLSGAMALLETDTNEVDIIDIKRADDDDEIDCEHFFNTVDEWAPERAVVEVVHSNNGLVERLGFVHCVCRLLRVPLLKVSVNRWKKVVLGHNTNDKTESIKKCQQLYPTADLLRPTPAGRKQNVDHNRAEAVLLAHYLTTL